MTLRRLRLEDIERLVRKPVASQTCNSYTVPKGFMTVETGYPHNELLDLTKTCGATFNLDLYVIYIYMYIYIYSYTHIYIKYAMQCNVMQGNVMYCNEM
jgi:amino acid transporter